MLISQFIAQNLHFAVNLFAGLVFFAVFWLYFDAWIGQNRKGAKDTAKWLGFLLVSLSFLPAATFVEQLDQTSAAFGSPANIVALTVRLLGYICIVAGQLLDPLQPKPVTQTLEEQFAASQPPSAAQAPAPEAPAAPQPPVPGTPQPPVATAAFSVGTGLLTSSWALPLGAAAIAVLYWRRATTGLERHLKPVAFAFFFLFLFELTGLSGLLRGTTNPALYDVVKAFGPVWIASQLGLLVGAALLGRWVWHYLTERFISQLFMTFTTVVLGVFLVTTVSFTFLLLQNIQSSALNNLATTTSVLTYALDGKKSTTQANAEVIAASPGVIQAIASKDHVGLVSQTGSFLANKQASSLVITDADGQVLLRAEDPDRWGDSISSDTLVRRALFGSSASTIESRSAVLAPVLSIRSVVPARDASGTIVGSISVSTVINSAFLDGIKQATGLEAAIYSGNVRSATTFTAPDGVTRWIGVTENDSTVQQTVLKQGTTYKGQLSLLNRQYLAVYAPLKDADNSIIGMIFIGQPEHDLLQTTTRLVGLTFIIAAGLLVLSIIPAYLIARHLTKQLE